jgi:hypothetical protein
MAHPPTNHSLSSIKKWGVVVEDYQRIHDWFDESKQITADFRHRALRHHAEGIFLAETIFGSTISLSTGRVIPVRWIGEQHVREDLGFIPSFADWVKANQARAVDGARSETRNRTAHGERSMTDRNKSPPEREKLCECPICGSGEVQIFSTVSITDGVTLEPPYFVVCECLTRTKFFESKAEAVNDWNNANIIRPITDPLAEYCGQCHGTGQLDKPTDYDCEDCKFFGQTVCTCAYVEICPTCDGSGIVHPKNANAPSKSTSQ